MAFLIFGLFWMVNDHASLWWTIPFVFFQVIESFPSDKSGELTRWELRRIAKLLERK